MYQLKMYVTSRFKKDLNDFMKLRHITTQSEAVHIAIKEDIQRAIARVKPGNFESWLGLANQAPANKSAKFSPDDDFWI